MLGGFVSGYRRKPTLSLAAGGAHFYLCMAARLGEALLEHRQPPLTDRYDARPRPTPSWPGPGARKEKALALAKASVLCGARWDESGHWFEAVQVP